MILFESRDEAISLTECYAVAEALPGHILIGLKNWDDFIVQNIENQLFTVPTVPLDAAHIRPLTVNPDPLTLRPDQRFAGKIKWYIKPIVFGGDPSDEKNTAWVSLDQHIEAVKWWNRTYRDLKRKKPTP